MTGVDQQDTPTTALDLDEVRATLADNGIDGPDAPYNPRALAAMRTADAMLAELIYRRTHPIDMQALARALAMPSGGVPADGSIILVNEEAAYVRSDHPADPPHHPDGDWWEIARADGAAGAGPLSLGEILDDGPRAVDDPPRRPNTCELLFTADDVLHIVAQVVKFGQVRDEHTIREAVQP